MSDYPRTLGASDISPSLRRLILELTQRLLGGPAPTHARLRAQFDHAEISQVELTGVGLFASFRIPPDAPLVEPGELIGGDAPLEVEGIRSGAGCLVKVSSGRLDFLEIYTYGNDAWPDEPVVLSVGTVTPIPVVAQAT